MPLRSARCLRRRAQRFLCGDVISFLPGNDTLVHKLQLRFEKQALIAERHTSRKRAASPVEQSSPSKRPRWQQRFPSRRDHQQAPEHSGAHSFRPRIDESTRVVCAICLGRHPISEVARCNLEQTWDGQPTWCSRNGARIITAEGNTICTDWQREAGCARTGHPERHKCSGCGSAGHGAHGCPRAEAA